MAELLTPIKRTFMPQFERYEPVAKDHSAMAVAKDCKRRYFYRIVLGRTPKDNAPYFAFGGAYHKFREVLETSKDFSIATKAAADYWKKNGNDPPVGAKYDFLTLERLLKSCLVAYQAWEKEKQSGRIEVVATEQNFDVTSPQGLRSTGRADQIVRWNGKLWGRDFKTSSRMGAFYARTLEPNDQFTRYTWAESLLCGEPVQGQIIEVMYNTKKEGPKIEGFTASRTDYQLKQWEKEQIFYDRRILQACREEDIWPMEETRCPFCPFHSVCKAPSEGAMIARLESDYIVKPWDPQHKEEEVLTDAEAS